MGRAIFRISLRDNRYGWTALAALAALSIGPGCQKTDKVLAPSIGGETTTLHATYRSDSTMLHDSRTQIVIDGQALEDEWGGAGSRDFLTVRVSSEQGSGDPGAPRYVAMKAIYTDQDVFFLVRWTDETEDVSKDRMEYVGPDVAEWGRSHPRECAPFLIEENNWIRDPRLRLDEDRMALAFQIDTTDAGSPGPDFTYGRKGCAIACHLGETPAFGRTTYAHLDVWEWLASRTNPIRDLFDPTDDANNPRWGVNGFLDDLFSDPVGGLQGDPGTAGFRPNFVEGSNVPLYVYRSADDPFARPRDPEACRNAWGERCRKNNGVSAAYIWREDIDARVAQFSACDTLNQAPLPVGTQPRLFTPHATVAANGDTIGDTVPGWLLTYPSGSRADVHGEALYGTGVWTLEIGRELQTSDPIHDVTFKPQSGRSYYFTVAIMDNSGTVHWGSEPQTLVFDPKGRAR